VLPAIAASMPGLHIPKMKRSLPELKSWEAQPHKALSLGMRERQEHAQRSWQSAPNGPDAEGGRALLRQGNKKEGASENRTRDLSHPKRALYH
jgi:hypothetical protein